MVLHIGDFKRAHHIFAFSPRLRRRRRNRDKRRTSICLVHGWGRGLRLLQPLLFDPAHCNHQVGILELILGLDVLVSDAGV